jgi:hypothetical protein
MGAGADAGTGFGVAMGAGVVGDAKPGCVVGAERLR